MAFLNEINTRATTPGSGSFSPRGILQEKLRREMGRGGEDMDENESKKQKQELGGLRGEHISTSPPSPSSGGSISSET